MFFFLFNEFYKSTYKYKESLRERRALEAKLKEIENDVMTNGIKSNGSTANGVNGLNGMNGVNGSTSLNQYYDSVNHNHINNKKNIEYNDNAYYGNGNANGTTELINRKTK